MSKSVVEGQMIGECECSCQRESGVLGESRIRDGQQLNWAVAMRGTVQPDRVSLTFHRHWISSGTRI